MNDTIQAIYNAILNNTNQSIEIIEKVDSFYNNAWSKLIIVVSIMGAIVGVFIPLMIQWYQNKTIKSSEEKLTNKLKEEVTKFKNELNNDLLTTIKEKFDEYENKLKTITASANAKIFFSQAKISIEKNYYKIALGEIVTASLFSIESNDLEMLPDLLEFLSNNCLPNLSKEEINDLKIEKNCDLHSFLERLSNIDDKFIFKSKIGEIKVKVDKLPQNLKDKPEEKNKTDNQ